MRSNPNAWRIADQSSYVANGSIAITRNSQMHCQRLVRFDRLNSSKNNSRGAARYRPYRHANKQSLPFAEAKDLILRCLDVLDKELKSFDRNEVCPYHLDQRSFSQRLGITQFARCLAVYLGLGQGRDMSTSRRSRRRRRRFAIRHRCAVWVVGCLHSLRDCGPASGQYACCSMCVADNASPAN